MTFFLISHLYILQIYIVEFFFFTFRIIISYPFYFWVNGHLKCHNIPVLLLFWLYVWIRAAIVFARFDSARRRTETMFENANELSIAYCLSSSSFILLFVTQYDQAATLTQEERLFKWLCSQTRSFALFNLSPTPINRWAKESNGNEHFLLLNIVEFRKSKLTQLFYEYFDQF